MIGDLEREVDRRTETDVYHSDSDNVERELYRLQDKCVNICHLVGRLLDVMVRREILTPEEAEKIVKDEL